MRNINASIITIGDELLIGQTIDTNSAYIGQALNKIGIWVQRRVAIGDAKSEITSALDEESKRSSIIIITGGLGPTGDDITKPVLCEYFGGTLTINTEAEENVIAIFKRFNRPLTERNLKQAEVPDTCTVLQNRRGTAPGMWFEKDNRIFISLPGVPNEMVGLMESAVIPRLKATMSLPVVIHRTLVTAGVGESVIADSIEEFENTLPSYIKLAYLPNYSLVRLRLTVRLEDQNEAERIADAKFSELKALVSEWMIAEDDIPLAELVLTELRSKKLTLSTAESCTGGYIAHQITSRAGSSDAFLGSIISYSNKVKETSLQVKAATLQSAGAVSEETVKQMVTGVLQAVGSDLAVATSGIMGPGGGTDTKPVGTVWIAVGNKDKIETRMFSFRFDRLRNLEMTAMNALVMLLRFARSRA